MILNLHFENFINDYFVYEGPYVMLERNCQYLVGIRKMHLELSTANKIQNEDELWAVSSNLVDQTPINPRQSLLYFKMKEFSKRQFFSSSSVTFYPLEKHQLDFPKFWIKRLSPENQPREYFIKAFIQLEITKNVGN